MIKFDKKGFYWVTYDFGGETIEKIVYYDGNHKLICTPLLYLGEDTNTFFKLFKIKAS